MLNEAAKALAAKQAADAGVREGERRAIGRRRTKEEIKAGNEEQHRHNMLHSGLARLREGMPPTKAQLPYIQAYIAEHEAKLKEAEEAARAAQGDAAYHERLYYGIVPMWNSVVEAIRSIDIDYFGVDGDHGWRGQVGEVSVEHRGHATEADALKAALAWRLEMAVQRKQ